MNEQELAALVAKIVQEQMGNTAVPSPSGDMVPVGVSNRHIHLSQEDFEVLFWERGYHDPFERSFPARSIRL